MRRHLLFAACLVLVAAAPAINAYAQSKQQEDDDSRRRAQADSDRKKQEKEKQWALPKVDVPQIKNVGPCPYVKVLYDAARYMEFKDAKQSPTAAGFTGEITGVRANCAYKGDDPIKVQLIVDFALGRGPAAGGGAKDFPYWVAVTERNSMVIAKSEFTVHGDFKEGDRVNASDTLAEIVIPRAKATTSGGNFEILVGFDVTPEMAAFNRDGKRFRANATAIASTSAPAKQ